MVAVMTGAPTGGKRKADNLSSKPGSLFVALFASLFILALFILAFFIAGGAVARSVAAPTEAIGARSVMKESKQAPNTLLFLGVWGIDWYMDSPYKIGKSGASAGTGARDVRMNE